MDSFVFDLDGVLLDFDKGYAKYLAENLAKLKTKNEKADPSAFSEIDFIYSEHFAKVPHIIEPKKFNQICQNKQVIFVTNIPSKAKKNRIKNLTSLGFVFSKLFVGGFSDYGEHDYPTKAEVLKKIFKPEEKFLFVDDLPQNCLNVKTHFPQATVFMLKSLRPTVDEVKNFDIIKNWKILEEKISLLS